MNNFGRCLLIFQTLGILTGCAEGQVQCCQGVPKSEAPMSHLDQRWNTFDYYNPAFDH